MLFMGYTLTAYSQNFNESVSYYISTIHEIEPVVNHYKQLKQFSSRKREAYAWMDDIVYPPENYLNWTIIFAIAEPHCLSSSQVDYIVNSVEYPANSSE